MPRLCRRAGCPAARLSPAATGPTHRRAPESLWLTADLLSDGLLLRENPQAEICLLVRLKRGWNKNVITRRQLEAVRYFPQINVGFAPGLGGVVPEEVFAQVSISAGALGGEMKAALHWLGCAGGCAYPFPKQKAKLCLEQASPLAVNPTLILSPRYSQQPSSHLMARTHYQWYFPTQKAT